MIDDSTYRVFLESAPEAFFVHRSDGRFIDVNRQACAALGYARDELLAMSVTQIDQNFDVATAAQIWKQVTDAGPQLLAGRHRRKDGTEFLVEVYVSTATVDGEQLFFGMARDVSERRRADLRQARLASLYQALSEVNHVITRGGDEPQLLAAVCRIAVEHGGMAMAWVGRPDAEQWVRSLAAHGSGTEYLQQALISADASRAEGRGPTGTALRESRPVVVNDFQHNANMAPWQPLAARYGWRASATFPLPRGGIPYAVLSVYHDSVDAFDEELVSLLCEMAQDIGFALDNIDREDERQQSIATIQQQNNFLKAIFESEPECVKVVSRAGELLQMNRAGLAMLDADSIDQLKAKGLQALVAVSHRDRFTDMHDRVCAGDNCVLEFPIISCKGNERWLEMHATPLRNAAGDIDAVLSITRDITQRKRFDEVVWRQANFDSLTGLPNRNLFYDRLQHELKRMLRIGQQLALVFIDLDHFKEVNDSVGHDAGDALLVEAAARIVASVRETDTVARLGGDEFTVLLPELAEKRDAERIVSTIIERLGEPFDIGPSRSRAYLSASAGITIYPDDATDVDQLMRNVDQAMYAAKNRGRNGYSFFVPALQEQARYKYQLLSDLRGALAAEQLVVHFQPIIDLRTHCVVKLEALLRWRHPQRGMVSPAEFIPLAEESGLIVDIGNWVFREVARHAARWVAQGHTALRVSVNVSPVQLHGEPPMIDECIDALSEFDLSGRHIVLEITEGLLLNADAAIKELLHRFRNAGMELAIDDFGTGYSALSYLKKFDIDYLKIDQSFVRDLATDPSDMALSEAIIVMAHKLGLRVVAEGVETLEQLALLRAAGCDYAQGYLFSAAVPAERIDTLWNVADQFLVAARSAE